MNKAVLLSIKPKYCELIANGKKTIEVRKTRPKLDIPFKCYIYCTNDYSNFKTKSRQNEFWIGEPLNSISKGRHIGNGKVIGEFVCDTIITDRTFGHDTMFNALSCMSGAEIASYCTANEMYGLHISDLTIYDKPKDLDEFMYFGKSNCDCKNCNNCLYMGIDGVCDIKDSYQPLFRPPQSWCYVESEASE